MKRSPLKPPTPEAVAAWETKPRRRLPAESAKHRAQKPTRTKVVQFVRARDRTCQAVGLYEHDCAGPLDCHEIIPRSAWAGGYLEPSNVILVCRRSHQWIDGHPEAARQLGLYGLASDRPNR